MQQGVAVLVAAQEEDVAIRHLRDAVLADASLIVVAGSSAGGYLTMMAGLIEVSKSQVAQLDRLIQVVDVFRKSLLHQESGDNFQEYDETAAGREGDVQEYLRSGLDRGEAEARARNGDVWRKMSITR